MEVIIIKRFISLVLALILVFAFSVSSFSAITADIQADDLASGWGSGSSLTYPTGYLTSWYYRVLYWLSQTKSDTSSILSSLGYKDSSNSNIITCLNHIMSHTAGSIGDYYYLNNNFETIATSDFFESVGANLFSIGSTLSLISYDLTTPFDRPIKSSSDGLKLSYLTNFLSSDSSNSVKGDDIGNLSSVTSSVKDSFSTGTSPSGVFDVVNSDSPWEWFTDGVANSLLADSSSSVSSFSLCSSPSENYDIVTSYYEENLNDFYSWLDLVGDTE